MTEKIVHLADYHDGPSYTTEQLLEEALARTRAGECPNGYALLLLGDEQGQRAFMSYGLALNDIIATLWHAALMFVLGDSKAE